MSLQILFLCLLKLVSTTKAHALAVHKILAGMCISIEKLDVVDAEVPSQEALDMQSTRLRRICLQVFPNFPDETNVCLLLDDTPSTPTSRNSVASNIKGLFHVLLHSGSLPALNNPEFELGLFHPHHIPDENFGTNLSLQWHVQRMSTHF